MVRRSTAAILLGAGALAGTLAMCGPFRSDPETAAGYETEVAQRGPIAARVTATGTLSPLVEVQVGSQVSGRIQSLFADFNSVVTKGQVVAKIDPRLFEADVARQRANVTAAGAAVSKAQADLTDARLKHERASGLFASGMGSKADHDSALAVYESFAAALESAKASLAQARAALEQSQTSLGYTTIVSPIDGFVISRDVDVGQTVAASLQAPTLFTIAEDLRKMEVHTHVAEGDVGRLTSGMRVEFGVDAYPTEVFRGAVREVRYAPQTVQNVVTYDAVVSIDNALLKLRPGMTAEVIFLIDQRREALLVPNAALRFVPPPETLERIAPPADVPGEAATSRVVWVLDGDGLPRPVRIRIGITDGRATEVAEGDLASGDRVITAVAGASTATERRPSFGRFL